MTSLSSAIKGTTIAAKTIALSSILDPLNPLAILIPISNPHHSSHQSPSPPTPPQPPYPLTPPSNHHSYPPLYYQPPILIRLLPHQPHRPPPLSLLPRNHPSILKYPPNFRQIILIYLLYLRPKLSMLTSVTRAAIHNVCSFHSRESPDCRVPFPKKNRARRLVGVSWWVGRGGRKGRGGEGREGRGKEGRGREGAYVWRGVGRALFGVVVL